MAKVMVDDTRTLQPFAKNEWVILRRGEDLPIWIDQNGWPEAIALDYDLQMGEGSWDGGDVARYLRNAFLTSGLPAEKFPLWDAHSSEPRNNVDVEEILAEYSARRVHGLAPIRAR
jgi:hypothetical protein